jgi:hypothetical protein
MKRLRLKKNTLTPGFEKKMDKVFNDYYDWYFEPSKSFPLAKLVAWKTPQWL